MLRAVIGLGSNMGDRLAHLREATARLGQHATVLATSPVYETAPVGGPPQGHFLNAALLVAFEGSPRALLDALLAIERSLGRIRLERWGPRTVDMDILWVDGLVVDEPGLTVPHPRLTERAFALLPMLDVAPDARDPRTGVRYEALAPSDARRVDDALA